MKYRVKHVAYYRYEATNDYEASSPADAREQAAAHASSCDFWDHAEQLFATQIDATDEGMTVTQLKEVQP